jgi:uncharacterized protein YqgV (UPF0045/DUF77 family)
MKINNNVAISDSGFLFNPVSGESFSVNPVGAEIINMLKEEKSLEQISEKLHSQYNTDETTIEKDLYDYISILKQYNLIESND